ncbi:MAG: hypothetical protein J0L94_06865 [Rhodothermia bacterium]|nr:hypothetical protein [Rhodothermia bacterium]
MTSVSDLTTLLEGDLSRKNIRQLTQILQAVLCIRGRVTMLGIARMSEIPYRSLSRFYDTCLVCLEQLIEAEEDRVRKEATKQEKLANKGGKRGRKAGTKNKAKVESDYPLLRAVKSCLGSLMAKIGSGGQEKSLSLGYWALDGYFGQRQRYQELFGMPFVSTEDVKRWKRRLKWRKLLFLQLPKPMQTFLIPIH